jgi:ribosomal protein L21E
MKFNKLVESILNENTEVSINKQIADLLAHGNKVYSSAMGRVGEVLSVTGNEVLIKTRKGKKGVTSFDQGDEVKIDKTPSGEYVVTNIF